MTTIDRLREAAQTLGIEVNSATTAAQLKALIGHCASPKKRPAPDEGADHKVPDEDVFRANEKDNNCIDAEIDARWNWVKSVVLVDSDMPMPIELVCENQSNLIENGWRVVLKEKAQWHFRLTDAKKAAKVEPESSAARAYWAKMREVQETEYALSQVADLINETEGESGDVSQKEEEKTTSVNTDDNHPYERRLAHALVVQGIDLMTAHKFSNMVFADTGLWTVREKRDLVAMMKIINPNGAATNAEAGLPAAEAAATTAETGVSGTEADSKSDASLNEGTSIVQAEALAAVASSQSTSAADSMAPVNTSRLNEPSAVKSTTAEPASQCN